MGIPRQSEQVQGAVTRVQEERQASARTPRTLHASVLTVAPFSAATPSDPAELELYCSLSRQTLADHGALITETGGDELHAIFQNPQMSHAVQAVVAALDLLQRAAVFRHVRLEAGAVPLRVSVGIHTPELPANRSSLSGVASRWTDTFSLTRCLGHLNRQTPFPAVFITGHTQRWLQLVAGWHVDYLGDVALDETGFKHPVFAVLLPFQ